MKKVLTSFLLVFYIAIIMYISFAIIKIDTLQNFVSAMVFDSISFVLISFVILGKMFTPNFKIGYFVPILLVTIVYVILTNTLNLVLVATLTSEMFILFNLLLSFFFSLVTIPMFIMGRK